MAPRRRPATHGGAREGAGRKPNADGARDATLSVRLPAELRDALDSWAEARGLTTSAAIVKLVTSATRRDARR